MALSFKLLMTGHGLFRPPPLQPLRGRTSFTGKSKPCRIDIERETYILSFVCVVFPTSSFLEMIWATLILKSPRTAFRTGRALVKVSNYQPLQCRMPTRVRHKSSSINLERVRRLHTYINGSEHGFIPTCTTRLFHSHMQINM